MKKKQIIGTAGHIDHGKTTLVEALTGTWTDRLLEEKKRGITIELGFTMLEIEDRSFGIVDVPGHEKLIKTMVAGATGIDLLLFVISAEDGIMPQTREHFDICTLLGIQKALFVITKTDLVSQEWLELVMYEVEEWKSTSSSYAESEIIGISAKTGIGIPELKKKILDLSQTVLEPTKKQQAYLPVDRVFEQKGFGCIATGTLYSGSLRTGQEVLFLPQNLHAKIRTLHSHNQEITSCFPGTRVAVNLQGIHKEQLQRGNVLLSDLECPTTTEIDVEVSLLPHYPNPLKHFSVLLFHAGTMQTECKVSFFTEKQLLPGEKTWARIVLQEPMALMASQRFILRGFQRIQHHGTTLGGGTIIDPLPPTRKKREDRTPLLEALQQENRQLALIALIDSAETNGLSKDAIHRRMPDSEKELELLFSQILHSKKVFLFSKHPPLYCSQKNLAKVKEQCLLQLKTYHQNNVLDVGCGREQWKKESGDFHEKLFLLAFQQLLDEKLVVEEKEKVRLTQFQIQISTNQEQLLEKMQTIYLEKEWMPPRNAEIAEELMLAPKELKPLWNLLVQEKKLVRVSEDLYFAKESIEKLQKQLIDWLQKKQSITPQEFKQLTNVTRKFSIPLAEYFDKQFVTKRVGNDRFLIKEKETE